MIYLDICSHSVPASQFGDDCATNMKAACLLTEEIRLNTPLLRCVSYAPSGTVKLCTSEMKSDGDAKA